jgi:hypothetical protein
MTSSNVSEEFAVARQIREAATIRLMWIAGRNGANRVKLLPSYTDLREFRRTRGRYGRQEKRHDRRRLGERYKSA